MKTNRKVYVIKADLLIQKRKAKCQIVVKRNKRIIGIMKELPTITGVITIITPLSTINSEFPKLQQQK